jgi:MFS family permease
MTESVARGVTATRRALRFVLLVGAIDLLADFTYEGARGVAGPFLAALGASGAAVGIATGVGEFLGYALRIVSGRLADRTHRFWPITIAGYVLQMCAVPALALAGRWEVAVGLLILERIGKATRNPPRDVMLSHAGKEMGGYGWAFGVHEALDQCGALFGPLAVAGILALRHDFHAAFAWLAVSGAATLLLLVVARLQYPRPEEMEPARPPIEARGMPRQFWIYLAGAAFVAAGFADYPLIAYHFEKASIVSGTGAAIFYAIAMGVSGLGSLVCGRLFDRHGLWVLVPLTLVTAAYAPLAFLGGVGVSLVGVVLWGLGMGVHGSIVTAAVATMIPSERRASAYGIFTAGYGTAWMLGSALLGSLYDVSLTWTAVAGVVLELAAIPFIVAVARR